MVKLLICDDEPSVCTLISRFVDCDKHRVELLGFAYDGESALKAIEQQRPHLVITDIRMPGIDGIELIRRVREWGLDTHFVIVSGYGTFDYARSAIRYQVDDFLVKPISERAVDEVVGKLCAVIEAQGASQGALTRAETALSASSQKVRTHFISNIIYNARLLGEKDTAHINAEYGFAFEDACFRVLVLNMLPVEKDMRITEAVRHAEAFMRGILKDKCLEYESYIDRDRVVVVVNYGTADAQVIDRVLDYLFDTMVHMQELTALVRMVLLTGPVVNCAKDIPRSYEEAGRLLPLGIISGYNGHFIAPEQPVSCPAVILPDDNALKGLKAALESGSRDILFNQLYNYISAQKRVVAECPDALEAIIQGLFECVHKLLPLHDDDHARDDAARLRVLREYPNCTGVRQLCELLCAELYKTVTLYTALTTNRKSLPVLKAKQYVIEHFPEQISLEDVADSVFLSPSYFSVVFKQEAGVTFGDYLAEVRIKAAKRYLAETNHTVVEVSRMVGYTDPKYFSRIFKKAVGLKPKEYRQIRVYNLEEGHE